MFTFFATHLVNSTKFFPVWNNRDSQQDPCRLDDVCDYASSYYALELLNLSLISTKNLHKYETDTVRDR